MMMDNISIVLDSLTPMIHNMIRRKFNWVISKSPDLKQDLVQVGYLSILKAYPNYDESKAKLSTYMYRVIFNDMLAFSCKWFGYDGSSRNHKARQPDFSIQHLTDTMYGDEECRDECKNGFLGVEEANYFSYELNTLLHQVLTEREYMVVYFMYFYGMTQTELAEKLKISKQAVSFQHCNAIKKLRLCFYN